MKRLFIVLLSLFLPFISFTQVIPANRTIDWTQAGVPGGIPTNRTVFTNVSGLDTNGVLDCSAGIQAAINACPSNGVVVLPAGVLVISNRLNIAANTGNFRPGNITLRGAGNTNTTLVNKTAGHEAILTGNFQTGNSNNLLISAMMQGASNLTLSGTGSIDFQAGDLLYLQRQDEDATNFTLVFNNEGLTNSSITASNISGNWYFYGQGLWSRNGSGDVFSQIVQCTGISGATISFWPPLYLTWTNSTPTGLYAYASRVLGASSGVGIESLAITNAANNNTCVSFIGSSGSWVSGCKMFGFGTPFVMLMGVCDCEVRDSDFLYASTNPPGGDCDAVQLNNSCVCKVENNTFSGYWEQLMMESSSSGNAILYNYFTNEFCGGGVALADHYIEADIYANHEAFDEANLFEGNIMAQFQADNYHGGCGYNTLFRNWIHGMDNPYGIPLTNNIKCIDLNRFGYYWNVVGNVVGSPAVASVPGSVYTAPTNGSFGIAINAMYRIGYPDMGNDIWNDSDVYINYQGAPGTTVYDYPINYDERVITTLFRTNNYDYVTAGIPDGTTVMPASLVYSSAPSWWGTNRWPAIDPNNSTLVAMIPAQQRFLGITNGTNNGTNVSAGSLIQHLHITY